MIRGGRRTSGKNNVNTKKKKDLFQDKLLNVFLFGKRESIKKDSGLINNTQNGG